MKVVGSHGMRDLSYGSFFALSRARTRLHSRSPHRRFLRSGGPPQAGNPPWNTPVAFAPACQGGWLGSYMGISQNFFGFKIPRISSTKISWNIKLSNIFLRHSHIAIWVWLFLWHFNAIFLWRPFFGSLDYGKNNQKYLEYSVEKISRSYPYPAKHPDWDDQPGT